EIFESADDKTVERLYNDKYIFMKYWYLPSRDYAKTILPGYKKGISGTTIGGYNIGIGGYLNEERRKAAVTALEYITSKKVQKKFIMERGLFSGILSLYDDKDVCNVIDCKFFKSFQPIARPTYITSDYNTYSEKFRNSIYKYLYENEDLIQSIRNILNLSKFYYIKISGEWDYVGMLFFILKIMVIGVMVVSLSVLKNSDTKVNFKFMSSCLWIMVVIGCIISLCSGFIGYGEVTKFKCHMKPILLSLGYSLITIPFLCKLIINSSDHHQLSEWVKNKTVIFISIMILLNLATIGLSFALSIEVEKITDVTGEFFKICKISGFINYFIMILLFSINMITSILIIILSFIERNIMETVRDIRLITIVVIVDIILVIIFICLSNNNFNTYESCFLAYESIFFVFSLSNYSILYGYRMLWDVFKRSYSHENNTETFAGFESKCSKISSPDLNNEENIEKSAMENV
ncbi:hypothetical protein PIROE2DRAFT_7468, partial [Piromyces sp. E2]